ncbi:nuclear transport factor 2 family protein [Humibacillus sp. DSM 29435]|uniref:nuclear transport factor 2 family protein n=1 Tax=Humibacillus sp. DSM 29435 TaxID=1869167 RepID=UPI001585EECA|nr:nuclear transport factor 2 family protein [Humibacillus sp. DSM 29435]
MTRLFDAVSAQDVAALLRCYHPEVTILESGELPYGGTYRGLEGALEHVRSFQAAWAPFMDRSQPLARSLTCDGEGTVTVAFRHQARSLASGRTLDEPEIGTYQVRDGLVIRSQMFHFEPAALCHFLSEESRPATDPHPPGAP